jgi:hypothetical protein
METAPRRLDFRGFGKDRQESVGWVSYLVLPHLGSLLNQHRGCPRVQPVPKTKGANEAQKFHDPADQESAGMGRFANDGSDGF